MQSSRENHRWDASGLPNVVLIDVEVRRCPACGERTVVIPRIEALHRALAMTVIARPGRLAPQEIRFLRKWLGWSGQDFARHFGVTPTTVSRWERLEDPSPMGGTAERLHWGPRTNRLDCDAKRETGGSCHAPSTNQVKSIAMRSMLGGSLG
jgi:putative zinc finger/helix-turn-helix YgiT family protein